MHAHTCARTRTHLHSHMVLVMLEDKHEPDAGGLPHGRGRRPRVGERTRDDLLQYPGVGRQETKFGRNPSHMHACSPINEVRGFVHGHVMPCIRPYPDQSSMRTMHTSLP